MAQLTGNDTARPASSSPRPWDERARLAALDTYAILDTPREPAFDDIAQLAGDVFEAPMAVVNLIAEGRQWFKAEVGIGADALPLDVSICAHAILQPGIMVVPDLAQDARFACNPLVTGEPGLRFYAGAVLETEDGLPLGTVCVLDTRPRPEGISDRQRLTLRVLARQVMTQPELRREIALRDTRARLLEAEIAGRRDADRALGESDRRLNAVLDNTRMAVFLMDEHQQCVYANAAAETLTGYSLAQMQGRPLHDVVHHKHPDGRHYPLADCPIDRAFPERAQMEGEEMFVAPDGSFYPVAFTASPVLDDRGQPIGTVIEVRDISARREMEDALQASDSRYRMLFEAIDAGFCIIEMMFDADGRPVDYRFVEANPAFERQTGLTAPIGRTARELVPGLEAHWFELYGAVASTGRSTRFENGSEAMGRWFDVHALRVGVPEARRVAILFNDITDRRRAELSLKALNDTLEHRVEAALAERKLWADVIENADALIGVVAPDYRYLALNTAYADEFERIYDVRPQVGDSLPALMERDPAHRDAVMAIWARALAGEEFTVVEEFGADESARAFYELRFNALRDRDGTFVGAFQYAVDVTARLRDQARLAETEEQLRQAQKMEAVGQLTGGIAHDFNNMLAVTIGSLDLLNRRIGAADARAKRYVEAAAEGARRAATLTQRLLAFSRQQPLRPEAVDANALIANMADLVRHSIGADVVLETVPAPALWRTHADPNQLENVILNLAINARDAMPEGGRVTIATGNADLDAHLAAGHADVAAGEYVRIAVSDTGTGMPPEVIARAFDPFFTTKGVGKGTGLGLSQVYGFVKQTGGHVNIRSEPGQGTTVEIYLPRLAGEDAIVAAAPAPVDLVLGEQEEVILVVEDEPAVRRFSIEALTELGYRVIEADTASGALDLLDAHPEILLLFTDVVMPEINGAKLAEEAQRRRPDLRVLFTTGYTGDAVFRNGAEAGVELIGKPFTIEELAARVRAVLETPPSR